MESMLRRMIGRIRLARGRCPACASAPSRSARCSVCLGHAGPLRSTDSTLLRWDWRFEGELRGFAPARHALGWRAAPRRAA